MRSCAISIRIKNEKFIWIEGVGEAGAAVCSLCRSVQARRRQPGLFSHMEELVTAGLTAHPFSFSFSYKSSRSILSHVYALSVTQLLLFPPKSSFSISLNYRLAPGGLRLGLRSLASGRVKLQERMRLHVIKNQF